MRIHIIRASGVEQHVDAPFGHIERLIGAEVMDTVNLRDGKVMLVDDNGHHRGLPRNAKATELYLSVCYEGTSHYFAGDVAIVTDAEVA